MRLIHFKIGLKIQTKCKNGNIDARNIEKGGRLDRGGLGSTIMASIKFLLYGLSTGIPYRPHSSWLWADISSNCTFQIPSIDCFSLPLSSCGYESIQTHYNINEAKIMKIDLKSMNLYFEPNIEKASICALGKLLKKPSIWV